MVHLADDALHRTYGNGDTTSSTSLNKVIRSVAVGTFILVIRPRVVLGALLVRHQSGSLPSVASHVPSLREVIVVASGMGQCLDTPGGSPPFTVWLHPVRASSVIHPGMSSGMGQGLVMPGGSPLFGSFTLYMLA